MFFESGWGPGSLYYKTVTLIIGVNKTLTPQDELQTSLANNRSGHNQSYLGGGGGAPGFLTPVVSYAPRL